MTSTPKMPGAGFKFPSISCSWNERDSLLFSASIGCKNNEGQFLNVSNDNISLIISCVLKHLRNSTPTSNRSPPIPPSSNSRVLISPPSTTTLRPACHAFPACLPLTKREFSTDNGTYKSSSPSPSLQPAKISSSKSHVSVCQTKARPA